MVNCYNLALSGQSVDCSSLKNFNPLPCFDFLDDSALFFMHPLLSMREKEQLELAKKSRSMAELECMFRILMKPV